MPNTTWKTATKVDDIAFVVVADERGGGSGTALSDERGVVSHQPGASKPIKAFSKSNGLGNCVLDKRERLVSLRVFTNQIEGKSKQQVVAVRLQTTVDESLSWSDKQSDPCRYRRRTTAQISLGYFSHERSKTNSMTTYS
jgi:hypothetical protein